MKTITANQAYRLAHKEGYKGNFVNFLEACGGCESHSNIGGYDEAETDAEYRKYREAQIAKGATESLTKAEWYKKQKTATEVKGFLDNLFGKGMELAKDKVKGALGDKAPADLPPSKDNSKFLGMPKIAAIGVGVALTGLIVYGIYKLVSAPAEAKK